MPDLATLKPNVKWTKYYFGLPAIYYSNILSFSRSSHCIYVYTIIINFLFTQAILVVFIVFSIGSTKIRSQYYRCRCLCRLELNQIVKILSSKSFDDFWNKIAQNSNLSTHTPSMYKVHRSTNLLKIKRIIWQLPTSFTTK